MGVAAADFDNDGFPDIFVTASARTVCFRNTGKGTFVDVTRASGLGGREAFSTSAMWVDVDRDGFLDLFVCNYVRWSAQDDVFCSLDGKQKSYCTPEAYRGDTCWLFRNRGNGTFEDVTATCGLFDSSSKSLGVALVDHDQDGWPDIFVANDTQPNKLYRNQRNGTFKDVARRGGRRVQRGRQGARRHGRRRRRHRQLGWNGAGDHELRGRDDRPLPRAAAGQAIRTRRCGPASAPRRATGSASAASSPISTSTARSISSSSTATSTTPCGTFAATSATRSRAHLFLNDGKGRFRDVAADVGGGFAQPRVGRGLAYGDFDRDGDVDLLDDDQQRPRGSLPERSSGRRIEACGSGSSGRSRTGTPSARPCASSTAARRRRAS